MKLRRLYDAEHALWSIIQGFGYTLTPEKAYQLANEYFHKYKNDFDLIDNYDDESPELESEIGTYRQRKHNG